MDNVDCWLFISCRNYLLCFSQFCFWKLKETFSRQHLRNSVFAYMRSWFLSLDTWLLRWGEHELNAMQYPFLTIHALLPRQKERGVNFALTLTFYFSHVLLDHANVSRVEWQAIVHRSASIQVQVNPDKLSREVWMKSGRKYENRWKGSNDNETVNKKT